MITAPSGLVAVSVIGSPSQIAWFAPASTDGVGLTVTVTLPEEVHPLASVNTAVYTVVVVGLTLTVGVVPKEVAPSNHSIVPVPEADIPTVFPEQIV